VLGQGVGIVKNDFVHEAVKGTDTFQVALLPPLTKDKPKAKVGFEFDQYEGDSTEPKKGYAQVRSSAHAWAVQ
jgi:hypothetical protein